LALRIAMSRLTALLVITAALALTGLSLRGVGKSIDTRSSSEPPVHCWMGGVRALVADMLWLRVQTCWEQRDPAGTVAALQRVAAVDPRPLTFWVNGARMLAYDLPAWRIEAAGGERVPAVATARIEVEHARLALNWLERARAHHPDAVVLTLERASIELNRLHDLEAAAESYRIAVTQPGAPAYAVRFQAELSRRLGRPRQPYLSR
jgi:hypothetical protein